ncbi:MAG: hypothetical protein J5565_06555 [Muribaculaceae bacterium]|nr:hypothetical protein [Muribaculaceae bacterium]
MDKKEGIAVAKKLAATEGYDHVESMGKWEGYSVYFACPKELLGACYGYPTYVLVDGNGNARFAKFPTEVEAILKALQV